MAERPGTGSEDFALEKVPDRARMGWFDVSLVYTGFVVITTAVVIGMILAASFPFWQAFWILAAGSAVVIANATLMGYIGYRERTSLGLTLRFGFGGQGSRLPSGLLVVTSQGWWIVQLLLLQSFLQGLGFWVAAALLVFSGVLMTVTTRSGLRRGMRWLNRVAIPALLALLAVSIYRAVGEGGGWGGVVGAEPGNPGELGVSAGIVMVASLWINGSTMFPDVARYARSGGAVVAGAAVAFLIGLFGLGLAGVVFHNALGAEEFGPAFAAVGLPYLAFAVVFAQIWTTNQSQMYSSSLAMSNALRVNRTTCESILLAISLLITVALSAFPFQDVFTGFLVFLGLFLTPIPGIVFAEYYAIRRMNVPERLEDLPALNKLALLTYAVTATLNVVLWAVVPGDAPIGLITLNPLTAFVLHLVFHATIGETRAFRRAAPSTE